MKFVLPEMLNLKKSKTSNKTNLTNKTYPT